MTQYKIGTRIDLNKDQYSTFTTLLNKAIRLVLPVIAIIALFDWMLKANGL